MSNFGRVLRIALGHRFTVAASLFCSLVVAVMWGGNITAIYPIVDIVMVGKSIPQWVHEQEAELRADIAVLEAEITGAKPLADDANDLEQAAAERKLAQLQSRQAKKRSDLSWYQRIGSTADQYLPATAFATLALVCLALLIGTISKSLFRVLGAYFTARLGYVTAFSIRKEFYRRTLRLDLGTFRQTSPGDLLNRFTGDVGIVSSATQDFFGMAIREPLKMFACLVGAAWISWQLLLMTLVTAPLAGYLIYWLAKALKRANRRALKELSVVYDRLEETISGMTVIKAFAQESRERSRFHQSSKLYFRRSMRIAFYNSLVSPVTEIMGIVMIVGAVLAGGYLVLNQQTHLFGLKISNEPLTHGWLTLFYGFLAGASDPVRRLSGIVNNMQRASAASDRIFELMDRESQVADPTIPQSLPAQLGRIEFQNVYFAYNPTEPVLRQIDLCVEPGETVAVVGPNGCGKSTLMNLIPRFYDAVGGRVTIDGVDVRDVRRRELRDRIGIVTQETLLFDDTVAENIRYGRTAATDEEVQAAAKQAHADQFILEKLSDGYETLVGPGGNRLSGGQRQRIALARAILRDPQILILDEATSQIDVESERLIHAVLEQFVQGRTAFMITHRPSTLALADRIVVMDHGRILDVGTFDELSVRCPLFCRLAHLDRRAIA